MIARPRSDWLLTTVNAVRELMVERLEKHSLDAEAEREMQMALEVIEVIWEELLGQTDMLTRERDRFQQFFDHAPDAYAVTDVGCNVREANRALVEILRCARADMLGKPLTRYVAEPERAAFLTKFVGAMQVPGDNPLTWRSRLQPVGAPAIDALLSVRSLPLRRSGVSGLCWLIRPL
jgi:PAS domain-containing protein